MKQEKLLNCLFDSLVDSPEAVKKVQSLRNKFNAPINKKLKQMQEKQ